MIRSIDLNKTVPLVTHVPFWEYPQSSAHETFPNKWHSWQFSACLVLVQLTIKDRKKLRTTMVSTYIS